MNEPGVPTLDQLRVFLVVVDAGSFAGAGRQLGRATSAISYGVANLEAQLGLTLFDRAGTRRPALTEAGRAMLAEARLIGQGVDGLRARARGLLQGLEAEVGLAVDVMLPPARLAGVLRAFAETFSTVALRLHVEALGAVTALVLEGRADIGLSGPLASEGAGIERIAAGQVEMVPVAAPGHPLARGEQVPGGARRHCQLVLTDRSSLTEGRDFSVISPHTWRIADLGAKHALLREGLGWGNMPLPAIEDDLASGRLVRLALPDLPAQPYALWALYRADSPPGPAAGWLLRRLVEDCAAEP